MYWASLHQARLGASETRPVFSYSFAKLRAEAVEVHFTDTAWSLLVIGSAAGVVAMGMLEEMTFGKYLKIATLPAFLGFVAAVGAWVAQYALIS